MREVVNDLIQYEDESHPSSQKEKEALALLNLQLNSVKAFRG